MRKSRSITLTLLAAAAMFSVACDEKKDAQIQRCVDANGRVVGDNNCQANGAYVPHGAYPYYLWYYGGRGYYPGETAQEGSFVPAADMETVRASSPAVAEALHAGEVSSHGSISRGGFGHGFGGGGE
jgi:hypothetical protein